MKNEISTNKPNSWLQGARTEAMPEWITKNPKAFRLLYEFAERSSREERDIEYQGILIHLSTREFITGRSSTSAKIGISEQEYKTLFKRFEKLGYIKTTKVTNRFTIVKYLSDGIFYNNPKTDKPANTPSRHPTVKPQITTNNKVKEIINKYPIIDEVNNDTSCEQIKAQIRERHPFLWRKTQ